jgi:hypothetical protein
MSVAVSSGPLGALESAQEDQDDDHGDEERDRPEKYAEGASLRTQRVEEGDETARTGVVLSASAIFLAGHPG